MKLILRRDAAIPEFVICQFKSGKTLRTEDILVVCVLMIVVALIMLLTKLPWLAFSSFSLSIAIFLATIFRKPWHDPRRKHHGP